jgi:hypothetical protein
VTEARVTGEGVASPYPRLHPHLSPLPPGRGEEEERGAV